MKLLKNFMATMLALILLFGTYSLTFAAGGGGGSNPLKFEAAYLTTITNGVSTTETNIKGYKNVGPDSTIKLVFDRNVVSNWETNSKAITLDDSLGNSVDIDVSRIPEEVNPDEKRNIFITPKQSLTLGENYTITIDASLTANNGSKLGNPETVSFGVKTEITPPELTISAPAPSTVTNQNKVTVSGTTEPGSIVKINDADVAVDEAGVFSKVVALTPGLNKLVVTATDASDNTTSKVLEITYDHEAVLSVTSPKNNMVTNTDKLAVTGSSEQGAVVTVNGTVVKLDANNGFSHELVLAKGVNKITVSATDAVGNTSTSELNVTYEPSAGNQPVNDGGGSTPTTVDTNDAAPVPVKATNTNTGNELPATASNTFNLMAAGMLLVLFGFGLILYPRLRQLKGR